MTLWTTLVPTPSVLAILRMPSPLARSSLIVASTDGLTLRRPSTIRPTSAGWVASFTPHRRVQLCHFDAAVPSAVSAARQGAALGWYGRAVGNVLVLWDVDYTLINAGGSSNQLYGMVFRQLFGRELDGVVDRKSTR